jgi:hypothetical protein
MVRSGNINYFGLFGQSMKRFCFILIALVCHLGPVNAADALLFMPRKYKCFEILQFESLPPPSQDGNYHIRSDQQNLLSQYFAVDGWLRGFFSARNVYDQATGGMGMKDTTEKEWMPWIYSYCRAHPTNNLLDAAEELSNTLASRPPPQE